jgi:hypothetical protein
MDLSPISCVSSLPAQACMISPERRTAAIAEDTDDP